ncbi:MAG TPA: methyltransferase [Micromonosporaceae bacterium]|nr:methyltransferase [Micromonosporaceae bacterium]
MLARKKLLGILAGPWLAQAVYAVVKLGVPDLLAEGPATASSLSAATGADQGALTRLLRALCSAGIFTQPTPGTFALTATGDLLRADVPGSVRLNALMQGDEVFRSFSEIMHTVLGKGPAFEKVYGYPFYDYLERNPEAAHTFTASMADQKPPEALATCDLSWASTIVDIGGGDGGLLLSLLEPHQLGVLVELPSAMVHARERLAPLGDRVSLVEGSFFDPVPPDGDVYVLCRVLHNWSDENAGLILQRIREAIPPHGRLVVLEDFLTEQGGGMVDLLMLVTLEGRDRTSAEYQELLQRNGFKVVEERPGVLEAVRGS